MAIDVRGLTPLLQVFDMRQSIGFYREVLGFEVIDRAKPMSEHSDDVGWAMLRLGEAVVMLNTAYDPEDVRESRDEARWAGHEDTCLYLGCPDVDGVYQQLKAQGLEIEAPKVAWYGMKQLYLKDPDGYGICFQWRA